MKKIILVVLLGFFFVNFSYAQFKIPEVPKKQTSVYDYSKLLSKNEARNLEQKLIRYSDSTSTQIVVIIIDSSKREDLNYLAANWGEKWGIGQKGKDNGIIILLAKSDRKVAIQAGRGTEAKLTDFMSKEIIDSRIIPEFKRGDYYAGLDAGTDGVFQVLTGEFKETRKRKKKNEEKMIPFFKGGVIFIIILIFVIVGIINRRNGGGGKGGRGSTTAALLDILILSSLGRSSGGSFGGGSSSGGFGGGGFSGGFGGGSFGGGGASGSW